jgi:hypothetical protein
MNTIALKDDARFTPDAWKDGIEFDRLGRMKFHPDFHQNHKTPFSQSDLEYLCKYFDVDPIRTIAFALGRTEHTCATKVSALKKQGLFEYYKNLNKHW